jgi:hypothetical protein
MKQWKDFVATLFSRLFDPVWMMPVAISSATVFAVSEGLRWRFLGLLLFIDAVVPLIFFVIMLLNRQIKDWDIHKREQRIPLMTFTLICHLAGLWLACELGKNELSAVLAVFYFTGLIFALITLKWKISLHAGINAVLFTAINVFYDWQYPWLYLILLGVMWARVYQRHHTPAQVVVGALVGMGLAASGLLLVL